MVYLFLYLATGGILFSIGPPVVNSSFDPFGAPQSCPTIDGQVSISSIESLTVSPSLIKMLILTIHMGPVDSRHRFLSVCRIEDAKKGYGFAAYTITYKLHVSGQAGNDTFQDIYPQRYTKTFSFESLWNPAGVCVMPQHDALFVLLHVDDGECN